MSYKIFISIIVILVLSSISFASNNLGGLKDQLSEKGLSIDQKLNRIVEHGSSAIVLIKNKEGKILRSGFLIKPNGYIITNGKNIRSKQEVIIKLANGKEVVGKVKKRSSDYDLALIKIPGHDMPYLEMGDSGFTLSVDTVISLGYPFKDETNYSHGMVYEIEKASKSQWDEHFGSFAKKEHDYLILIKTDALPQKMSIGTPLLNLKGEVIGVNSIVQKDNKSYVYAIAINEVFEVFQKAEKKKEAKKGKFNTQTRGIKYAMYVPSAYSPSKKWPLILVFHPAGNGGEIRDFWVEKAEESGFIIAGGYSVGGNLWELSDDYKVFKMIDDICSTYSIDKNRIYLTGLSGGAVFVYYLGIIYPEVFRAMAPVSGAMFNVKDNLEFSRKAPKHIPVLIIQGGKDDVVPARVARKAKSVLESYGYRVNYYEIPEMGHEHLPYKDEIYKEIIKFYNKYN